MIPTDDLRKIEPHAGFDGLRLPPPLGLNRVLSRLPGEIAGPWTRFANSLLTCGIIPPTLRELAILRTASRWRCDYIIGPHRMIGRHLGLTEQEVSLALAPANRSAGSGLESPAEVVLAATDQLLESGDVDAPVRRLLDLVVGRDGIPELALVVGQYVTVGFLCKTAGLGPEPALMD
jgi:4-carboxymuconolactone decarboxylase